MYELDMSGQDFFFSFSDYQNQTLFPVLLSKHMFTTYVNILSLHSNGNDRQLKETDIIFIFRVSHCKCDSFSYEHAGIIPENASYKN